MHRVSGTPILDKPGAAYRKHSVCIGCASRQWNRADVLIHPPVGRALNMTPLLARLETVTTTFPVVAPLGTGTTILVSLQLVGVANVPLKVTVLDPCVAPKPTPVIVTGVPGKPLAGDRLAIPKVTVKLTPLLATPLAVTTTFPSLRQPGRKLKYWSHSSLWPRLLPPLKLTVPDPCVAPKFVPVIVTAAPTAPDVIDRLVMLGPEPPQSSTRCCSLRWQIPPRSPSSPPKEPWSQCSSRSSP